MIPVQAVGHYGPHNQICSDWKAGETLYPQQWFVENKQPRPTLTGRQQFLIDHPWYMDAGEALPVHKDAPKAGGDYPLRLTGGHTRWSIHAIWRDQRHLLRLQRGEPIMVMSVEDARARSLADHDEARVYNDVGSFFIRVRPSPAVKPGQVIIYHAWENFQFRDWMQSQVAVPSPWKPLHVLGGYGHLRYRMFYAAPSHGPRFGAEVAAVVAQEAFLTLDAPVRRLAVPDVPTPYNVALMNALLPGVEAIAAAMAELIEF